MHQPAVKMKRFEQKLAKTAKKPVRQAQGRKIKMLRVFKLLSTASEIPATLFLKGMTHLEWPISPILPEEPLRDFQFRTRNLKPRNIEFFASFANFCSNSSYSGLVRISADQW
jgi:hypothetical protein